MLNEQFRLLEWIRMFGVVLISIVVLVLVIINLVLLLICHFLLFFHLFLLQFLLSFLSHVCHNLVKTKRSFWLWFRLIRHGWHRHRRWIKDRRLGHSNWRLTTLHIRHGRHRHRWHRHLSWIKYGCCWLRQRHHSLETCRIRQFWRCLNFRLSSLFSSIIRCHFVRVSRLLLCLQWCFFLSNCLPTIFFRCFYFIFFFQFLFILT